MSKQYMTVATMIRCGVWGGTTPHTTYEVSKAAVRGEGTARSADMQHGKTLKLYTVTMTDHPVYYTLHKGGIKAEIMMLIVMERMHETPDAPSIHQYWLNGNNYEGVSQQLIDQLCVYMKNTNDTSRFAFVTMYAQELEDQVTRSHAEFLLLQQQIAQLERLLQRKEQR